jgi:prepilin-type N-terminal cleavage/methylation domain-containing protein
MRVIRQTSERRSAFTLIELVVVIAIILALAALLLAGVMRSVTVADELKNTNDIRQLDIAVQSFLSKYNVPYLPSRIRLVRTNSGAGGTYDTSVNASGQPNTPLDFDSFQYLKRLWPRLVITAASPVNWDGNPGGATNSWTLQGQECLVFFLGGIPASSGGVNRCLGFSTDPTNPSNTGVTMNPPFYDFRAERLAAGPSGAYFQYLDAFGTKPYAYFSSYKTSNGYNRYSTTVSDCSGIDANLPNGVWPYQEAAGRFLKPDSYQIVSAGKNGLFGSGSDPSASPTVFWNPRTASDVYPIVKASDTSVPVTLKFGFDDQSNFYERPLGTSAP